MSGPWAGPQWGSGHQAPAGRLCHRRGAGPLGTTLLAITENGYGKRTHIGSTSVRGEPQHRGGFGLKGYQITEKTGKAAGVKVVEEDDDILLISDDGTIIRMAAADVNLYSRTAQGSPGDAGVRGGNKVISLARFPRRMKRKPRRRHKWKKSFERSPSPLA